jgi:hypothetical protein
VARRLDVEIVGRGEAVVQALASLNEALDHYSMDRARPEGREPPIVDTLRLAA